MSTQDQLLGYYERGATAMFACAYDQRFSYCLYVPACYEERGADIYPLVVLIHGSARTPMKYRELFADFAEQHRCLVLAPLFPCGIIEPRETNNYKFIKYHDIRYDHVLLHMIDEVAAIYRVCGEQFFMHGFSGGGHFAHRFFYLHPSRLAGVSIGAPGLVTLLDEKQNWWCGVADFEAQFGQALDYPAMGRVPVHMVIGAEDRETWEITVAPDSRLWMPGANDAGVDRLQRLASLKASFERAGIAVQYDIVAAVAHAGYDLLEPVKAFFAEHIARWRDTLQ